MAKVVRGSDSVPTVLLCEHCTNQTFKQIQDFVRHLRDQHCSREGGSFVCLYGYNGVCTSLPVEGVSDKDYIAHAMKHAIMQQQRKSNGELSEASSSWTVYSAVQNLPAVLNDPFKGKQSNFLTRTWGDGFIEKIDIPKSPYLPEVTMQHFEMYLKKIARRYRKHSRMNLNANKPTTPNELLQNFPNLKKVKSLDRLQFDLTNIPKIFLVPNLDLSQKDNFDAVFPFAKDGLLTEECNIVMHVKQMQEKLSHYLDVVEVRIAEQVASKSQAFFHAMTSHDVLMEQLTQTITVLKALRKNIHQVDKHLVKNSLEILRLERARSNRLLVQEKLKLMATVHQSQPMIQLLLSTPDYVAALDLISTTQEILLQELNGIHSFRHLSSQLTEMEKLVDKMLSTEFQRYATADLNRPLGGENTVLDGDKLVSIISGLLRQKHFQFVDTYKEEAVTTVRALTKQRVIEALAASDCCSDQQAAALEVGGLSLTERLSLLHNTIQSFTFLLLRVKAVHDVMKDTADLSAGRLCDGSFDESVPDRLLTREEHSRVITKLCDMITSVCDYCHERMGNLLSAGASERDKFHNDKDKIIADVSQNKLEDKDHHTWNDKNSWLSERATAAQVCQLANMVEEFTHTCEKLCGKQCTALRSAFKAQASKFVHRFHNERKTKLTLLLESERWKQADVPLEFQSLVTYVYEKKRFPLKIPTCEDSTKNESVGNFILVGDEKFAVVGTALMLIQMIHEYCRTGNELVALSGTIGRQLAELLRHYNSRCCQLVLGAGAMEVAGLKTITSTILVLAARSLKLVLWFMPFVKAHFQALTEQNPSRGLIGTSGISGGVALLDSVERDIRAHVREIEGKILIIVDNLLGGQISKWTARPPVPSKSFRNISSYLMKLHEAVSGILPTVEVQSLYRTVNSSFKEKLREQLVKMNIVNNGGPQHGVVTSELTFYLEALRKLKVLPNEELNDNWMSDIWTR
ncbi:PREDICTED: vacuolar protein sorting-associated protein 54 [Trachymyrmex cornetzi]|uniref:vacuolar protein sorting-associated protein 54 n=1 Tax=Trachymyrmex cornetzi TaxID=471704 RepID=UPI00084F6C6C|nr:PREDICTED: vacuolar protein sorting-associated protein 54 [Trachymyrmex cornetzi]